MPRLSRGCLRCRQRRVRCDEGRPSCQRCINRNEICQGYRDEASIIFHHETEKVIGLANVRASHAFSPINSRPSSKSQPSLRKRSRSVDAGSRLSSSAPRSNLNLDPSTLAPGEAAGIKLTNTQPWLKETPSEMMAPVEEQAVDSFMDKSGSRCTREKGVTVMALSALGNSLDTPRKVPDDYDLMTVVVLDIFETLYIPKEAAKESHAQGMAQILRLRGSELVYSSRGWSLFRLAHHRIQKQQLSFNMRPVSDTVDLLDHLNDDEPYVRLEKNTNAINDTCKRARALLELINNGSLPASTIVDMVSELHSLDQSAVSWRQTSKWSFRNLKVFERPDLESPALGITDTIQLHPDLWMAYEWNYHRAARITFLEQLIKCSKAALEVSNLDDVKEQMLIDTIAKCTSTIQWLANEVLSTVPQSLGDIDHMGWVHDTKNGPPRCRAIGGYLLLWPIRISKGPSSSTTPEQKERASRVFERIRDYTGMKATLGDKSII